MKQRNKGKVCDLPECGLPARVRGYCKTHYRRLLRHGDVNKLTHHGKFALQKWVEKHATFEGDECLPWPFTRRSDGQGQITVNRVNHKVPYFMCLKVHGVPPSEDYEATHSCGNSRLGCANPKHLSWQRRNEKEPPVTFRACSVEGCDGNAHYTARGAYGYCRPHYRRWKNHGDPVEGYALWGAGQKFFDEVVIPCQSEECLIWPYGRRNGYGVMRSDGQSKPAHRLACIAVHGDPPSPKHEAAHSCGNGHLGCVNPKHLRWATPSENQLDRALHGTSNRGERCGSAKLTRAQVREIRAQVGKRRVKDIAADYGVIPATIGEIRRRDTWSWLD